MSEENVCEPFSRVSIFSDRRLMANEARWSCDSDEVVVHADVHEDSMNVSYPDFATTGQVRIH